MTEKGELLVNKKFKSNLMYKIQTQQSVYLGFTEVTHHKNQYLILGMQIHGKVCNEYTLLYNSIRLC